MNVFITMLTSVLPVAAPKSGTRKRAAGVRATQVGPPPPVQQYLPAPAVVPPQIDGVPVQVGAPPAQVLPAVSQSWPAFVAVPLHCFMALFGVPAAKTTFLEYVLCVVL